MTTQQLREVIESAAVASAATAAPGTVAYCVAVRDAIRAGVPGVGTEVYVRGNQFIAKAWIGAAEATFDALLA